MNCCQGLARDVLDCIVPAGWHSLVCSVALVLAAVSAATAAPLVLDNFESAELEGWTV